MGSGLRLRAEEAVPLAHALIARLADDLGLRALAIKGPAVALQGLREPRTSADVDVLVHPRDLEPLVEGVVALGWRRQVAGTYASIMPPHSVNLLSDRWPIGIDVHHYYPGFLADAGDGLRRPVGSTRAGHPCGGARTGVRPGGSGRHRGAAPSEGQPRRRECRAAGPRCSVRGRRCLRRTYRPSCGWPMRRMRPTPCGRSSSRWAWRMRSSGRHATPRPSTRGTDGSARSGTRHGSCASRRRPSASGHATFWHALMLTDEEIYVYSNVPPGEGNLTVLRLRRIRRGVAGVPRTVKAMARSAGGPRAAEGRRASAR